jgi:hypothetical protein
MIIYFDLFKLELSKYLLNIYEEKMCVHTN